MEYPFSTDEIEENPLITSFDEKVYEGKEFAEALLQINKAHMTCKHTPRSKMLIANAGTGKSVVAKAYRDAFPKYKVIIATLDEKTSIGDIWSVLLKELGDPSPYSGRPKAIKDRLLQYLNRLGTQLIIIDETHHVLPEATVIRLQEAADAFKTLIDKSNIPCVFVGLPDADRLLKLGFKNRNKEQQFRQRCSKTIYMTAPKYGSKRWKKYVEHYKSALPMPVIKLSTDEMLMRLYVATEGYHRRMSKLFTEVIKAWNGTDQITHSHLAEAYLESESDYDYPENPFTCSDKNLQMYLTVATAKHIAEHDYVYDPRSRDAEQKMGKK